MIASSTTIMIVLLCFASVSFGRSNSVVAVVAAPAQQPQDTASTPTVAVAVQRSASAKHSYVIAHAVCFGQSGSAPTCDEGDCDEGKSVDNDAAVCCNAMKRAVRFLCLHAQTNTGKGDDSSSFVLANHSICRGSGAGSDAKAASWEHSCAENIASVPSYMYVPGAGTKDEVLVPTQMLSIWDQEIAATSTTYGDIHNANTKFSFGLIGEQYVWDGLSGGGWHSESSSPFLIAGFEEDTNSSHAQSSVPARIISSVSESGGMHRTHSHRIVLSLGQIIDDGASEARGDVTVLLPLSEGLFMDIDDALQDDGYCTVASMGGHCSAGVMPLPQGVVVDIEQPSFASQQHVLAIQVSFQLQNLQQQGHLPDIALDFASNLHLRYQAPLMDGDKGTEAGPRTVPVYVPSTFIGGGHFVVVKGEDGEGATHLFSIDGGQVQRDALIVEAGTGHDRDYIFVVVATLFASVIGSLAMIRDFSRVSRWV